MGRSHVDTNVGRLSQAWSSKKILLLYMGAWNHISFTILFVHKSHLTVSTGRYVSIFYSCYVMSSIGKLAASLASGTAENTLALLNINLDFSLYKVQASKEFEGVGSHLSLSKRKVAESGSLHVTARKLTALFERLIPPIPGLTKAYGIRASEIAEIPVNHLSAVYESVVEAWRLSMVQMEKLVQGIPQQACNGAILLAMTSWHLYPDMIVLQDKSVVIQQSDPLFVRGNQKGIITVGLEQPQTKSSGEGIFWSLPLAHLRYYGNPVRTLRSIGSGERSRITVDQLWQAVLASYLHKWDDRRGNTKILYTWFIRFADMLKEKFSASCQCHEDVHDEKFWWLTLLSAAAKRHLNTEDTNAQLADKLRSLGKTYGPFKETIPFFGLMKLSNFISVSKMNHDDLIEIIRTSARRIQCEDKDLLIRYKRFYPRSGITLYEYASAIPWVNVSVVPLSATGMKRKLEFIESRERMSGHRRWLLIPRTKDDHHIPIPDRDCDNYFYDEFIGDLGSISPSGEPTYEENCGAPSTTEAKYDVDAHKLRLWEDLEQRVIELAGKGEYATAFDRDFEELEDRNVLRYRHTESKHTYFSLLGEHDYVQVYYAVRLRNDQLKDTNRTLTSSFLERPDTIEDDIHNDDIPSGNAVLEMGKKASDCWSIDEDTRDISTVARFLRQKAMESEKRDPDRWLADIYSESKDLIAVRSLMDQQDPRMITWFTPDYVSADKCAQALVKVIGNRNADADSKALGTLRALSSLTKFASSLDDFTLDVRVIRQDLVDSQWYRSTLSSSFLGRRCNMSLDFLGPISMNLSQGFACIAMLETGRFNLNPLQLTKVMAMSSEDSLYIATSLISDPWDTSTGDALMKRVVGNVGRAGVAFIVPPTNPMILEMDIDHWYQINHSEFDGKVSNYFDKTALQLSFTEAIFPIDVGSVGGRDIEAYFMEALISVYDGGKWIADLDILNALGSTLFLRLYCCGEVERGAWRTSNGASQIAKLLSIDSFAELLMPLPEGTGIVRAHKNWQARLATAVLCIAKGHRTMILPREFCWGCLRLQLNNADFVIS